MPETLLPLAVLAVLAALAYGAAACHAVLVTGRVSALGAPLAEAARLLVQQRRRTTLPDLLLTRIGVWSLPVAAVLAAAVLPVVGGPLADPPVGVVWFNAMEVCVWGSVWLTGWGGNSVFPLAGGYRFVAQGLAYELPHMFALITAALGAGSLRVGEVAGAQRELWFAVWMPVALAVYLVSALAMAFWGPFGQPLGSDIAGGAAAELSGPDRLIFQAGRHVLLVVAAAGAVALFLGGGAGPVLPPWAWTPLKTAAVLAVLVWARHRLPAVRMDRFTQVSWLVLIPATLLQMLVVGIVVL
ncbi:NADH-quinone oxidoreductase subunit H [Microbispora cellulosiformans]|uniref:NADH-quinone oxidoreductase subunit H n=1 Tax=Microbispora cellulosiformans TaxID=2614688 RepID=A0A5J5JYL9_9ACTN|nr:NADH-quinone oxidoreductase subunit H [Microbispora cellulosiformans]KAA9375505.1 NADH-quinone oxidoreductase subunit H [Microbispora cellulosiformans]